MEHRLLSFWNRNPWRIMPVSKWLITVLSTCPLSRVVLLPNGPIRLTDGGLLTTETTWDDPPSTSVFLQRRHVSYVTHPPTPQPWASRKRKIQIDGFHMIEESMPWICLVTMLGKSVKNVKTCVPKWWEFHGDESHGKKYDSLKSHRKKTNHSSNYPIWVPHGQNTCHSPQKVGEYKAYINQYKVTVPSTFTLLYILGCPPSQFFDHL